MRRLLFAVLGCALLAQPSGAAEVRVHYTALEKLLRHPDRPGEARYVSGKQGEESWVYVRNARVTRDGKEHLRLTARFRAAFAGVDMPQEMDIAVRALPWIDGGSLTLKEPQISVGTMVIPVSKVVEPLLAKVRIDLEQKLKELVGSRASSDGIELELTEFHVDPTITLDGAHARLDVTFKLEVK
jgi:hypothetical protein